MHLYVRAISYFRADRFLILALVALIGLAVVVGLLQAWPLAILIDSVLTRRPQTDWIHRLFLAPLPVTRLGQIVGITLIGLGLKVLQDTITFARVMINNRLRYNGSARARCQLFEKIQELGLPYQKIQPQGDTIYRMENDTGGMFGILDTFIATGVAGVTLLGMIAIMLSRNVALTVFALAVAPLLGWINLWFGRRIRERALDSKHADALFTTAVQRSLCEMGLIHIFNRQRDQAVQVAAAVQNSVIRGMRLNWQEALYPLARDTIFTLGGAIVFGYGGYLVYRDQFLNPIAGGVTCGVLLVFMDYLGKLWDPLSRLVGFSAAIQASAAAVYRVFQVLDRRPHVTQAPHALRLPLKLRDISIRDVSFEHDPGKPVLDDVTVDIHAGESVAFVGTSGAGKSTLLHLLPRLFDPSGGSILLDEIDLRDIDMADVRRHVALVPQDAPVLGTTIAQNIAFGRPDANIRQIIAAAELAGADDFICALPDGYQTVMDLDGRNLSGGQRQRLAIARAFLSEAPILVLDEPTSAQDARHERHVIRSLKSMRRKRTVILVTHRLETAVQCDRIFVMDRGRIAEQGTHANLLALGGLYFKMWHVKPPTPTPDPELWAAA